MKDILVLVFIGVVLSIVLVGCEPSTESDVTLDGAADLNVTENFTECQVRQNVNSLIVKQDGQDEYIFIFDPSVTYPDEYLTLTEADALRVTPLTQEEQDIIDGIN